MAKYYVACGPIERVIAADSAEQAAMRIIHDAMQDHLWIYQDECLNDAVRHDHLMLEALLHLDPAIRISERGFGRPDATAIGTPEAIERWHRTMVGVHRIIQDAGLAPEMVRSIVGSSKQATASPRRPR